MMRKEPQTPTDNIKGKIPPAPPIKNKSYKSKYLNLIEDFKWVQKKLDLACNADYDITLALHMKGAMDKIKESLDKHDEM